MKRRLTLLSLALVTWLPAVQAAPNCQFESATGRQRKIGPWIDKGNWLDIENQRFSLTAGAVFMPALRLAPAPGSEPLRPAPRPLAIETIASTDPLDGRPRDLAFLLDSRLDADGVLILHNGRILAERYRNGLRPDEPRLLLQATRPLLNLLGAISIAQGKLAADKSVSRYIPALNGQSGPRKLSIQRLLEGEERYNWTRRTGKLAASRWLDQRKPRRPASAPWLRQKGRWDKPLVESEAPPCPPDQATTCSPGRSAKATRRRSPNSSANNYWRAAARNIQCSG
jgi:hypothetical protein